MSELKLRPPTLPGAEDAEKFREKRGPSLRPEPTLRVGKAKASRDFARDDNVVRSDRSRGLKAVLPRLI